MFRTILTAFIAFAFLSAASFAQDPEHIKKLSPQKHREVMPVHVKMLEEQQKQDAELEPLLAAMNTATGDKRMDAMVAVVNKLIEQRKAMFEKIAPHLDG